MYTRIVVPLDGSDLAEHGLIEAEQLANLTGAPIHILRVVDVSNRERAALSIAMDGANIGYLMHEEEESGRAYLGALQAQLAEDGIAATTHLLVGNTVSRIVEFAQPGDVIVMASHGRSGIRRWFMGSVAEDVLRHATVPILLTRPGTYTGRTTAHANAAVLSAT